MGCDRALLGGGDVAVTPLRHTRSCGKNLDGGLERERGVCSVRHLVQDVSGDGWHCGSHAKLIGRCSNPG